MLCNSVIQRQRQIYVQYSLHLTRVDEEMNIATTARVSWRDMNIGKKTRFRADGKLEKKFTKIRETK